MAMTLLEAIRRTPLGVAGLALLVGCVAPQQGGGAPSAGAPGTMDAAASAELALACTDVVISRDPAVSAAVGAVNSMAAPLFSGAALPAHAQRATAVEGLRIEAEDIDRTVAALAIARRVRGGALWLDSWSAAAGRRRAAIEALRGDDRNRILDALRPIVSRSGTAAPPEGGAYRVNERDCLYAFTGVSMVDGALEPGEVGRVARTCAETFNRRVAMRFREATRSRSPGDAAKVRDELDRTAREMADVTASSDPDWRRVVAEHVRVSGVAADRVMALASGDGARIDTAFGHTPSLYFGEVTTYGGPPSIWMRLGLDGRDCSREP